MILLVISQMAADAAGQVSPLYTYGPLGVITAFFMLASYQLVGVIREDGVELRKEIKILTHRLDGLQRAMWADMVERETCGPKTRQFAREEIAKIDARMRD